MVGRLLSFWDGLFSGAVLNFQGVWEEGYVPNKNQLPGGREFQKLLPVQEASPVMLAAMVGITRVMDPNVGKRRQDEKIGNINGGLRIPGANGRVNEQV